MLHLSVQIIRLNSLANFTCMQLWHAYIQAWAVPMKKTTRNQEHKRLLLDLVNCIILTLVHSFLFEICFRWILDSIRFIQKDSSCLFKKVCLLCKSL